MKTTLPDPFSIVLGAGEETYGHGGYYYDNRGRGSAGDLVVQQTLGGAGFFEDAAGRHPVGEARAMLFTHDEPSAYGYPPEATAPYRLRYLVFRLAGLSLWLERIRTEFGPVVRMPVEGEASAILEEAIHRFRERAFRDRFQETELLHRLLIAIYRGQVAATQTHDPIEYGGHYLRDNFRSPLNLKEVAGRCGVSREHFIRNFGKRYGEPPGALLRRLRLEHAHRMLGATHLPVQEVALASGFADANTFCRAYRLRYGATPGSTRRR